MNEFKSENGINEENVEARVKDDLNNEPSALPSSPDNFETDENIEDAGKTPEATAEAEDMPDEVTATEVTAESEDTSAEFKSPKAATENKDISSTAETPEMNTNTDTNGIDEKDGAFENSAESGGEGANTDSEGYVNYDDYNSGNYVADDGGEVDNYEADDSGESGNYNNRNNYENDVEIKACDAEFELDEDDGEKQKEIKIGNRLIDSLFDFIELFIFSLAAVFILTTFFFRHSVVEGSSMENTLFEGEHIIISDFLYKPERGDIVVCEDYSLDVEAMRKPIVKRVIAIAGDTIEIDTDGNVILNGEMLKEDYVYIGNNINYWERPKEMAPITIKEGEVFVMGDHRDVSSDSRAVGPIKEDSILGKVLFRFYPFDKFGAVE
ncbi:MAG: signal peptidase I [Ruminococcaceae bacterium]|nr:signal peptidase I [Oscillospiraceae bacterium]